MTDSARAGEPDTFPRPGVTPDASAPSPSDLAATGQAPTAQRPEPGRAPQAPGDAAVEVPVVDDLPWLEFTIRPC